MKNGFLIGLWRFLAVQGLALWLGGCAVLGNNAPDVHGHWSLKSVDGEPVNMGKKNKNAVFTLILDNTGSASGKVACNSWRASYLLQGNTLIVSQAMSTRAFCLLPSGSLKEVESDFLGALKNAEVTRVTEQELTLTTQKGQEWVFSR